MVTDVYTTKRLAKDSEMEYLLTVTDDGDYELQTRPRDSKGRWSAPMKVVEVRP